MASVRSSLAPERAGHAAADLRHLDRVRQPVAVVVALVVDEDLRLVFEPAEGGRVDDAVAVALEGRPVGVFGLGMLAPAAVAAGHGVRRQHWRARGLRDPLCTGTCDTS